jgi:hypothetical protein
MIGKSFELGIVQWTFFKIFQVYEMFLAGYSFHVLNNAFLSHWGFSKKNSTPTWDRFDKHFFFPIYRRLKRLSLVGPSSLF